MTENGNITNIPNGKLPLVLPKIAKTHNLPPVKIYDGPEIVLPETPAHQIKQKRRDKSDLGDNFIAPDGGWGWVVTIAAGFAILVAYAPAQTYGIIFRKRLCQLGITNSQITTIANTQIALSSFTGLLNGPMFRRYTFRQVGYFAAVFLFSGLFLAAFANSFLFFILSLSLLYGIGRGLMLSSTSMAVNTYFSKKRRTATSYQWGLAGLGPVLMPFVTTDLLEYYGYQGMVLLAAGFSLHSIACALIFQPVQWHMKKPPSESVELNPETDNIEEMEVITGPETPMVAHANDGWFGSRTSINTAGLRTRRNSSCQPEDFSTPMREFKRLNSITSRAHAFSVSYSIKEEQQEHAHDEVAEMQPLQLKKELPKLHHEIHENDDEETRKQLPFYKKIIIFFDLDLLRDFTYMNLAVGLTLINFVDQNFNMLLPFILADFHFTNNEIAIVMTLLGICDLVIRFAIPTITNKLSFTNQTYICIGTIGMCLGRVFLSFTQSFSLLVVVCLWIGFNKALRVVFWPLLIPGYVPLKRLPAASGLQLLMGGVISLILGPLIGLVRDSSNYVVTLNVLNIFAYISIAMWIIEACLRKRKSRKTKDAQSA